MRRNGNDQTRPDRSARSRCALLFLIAATLGSSAGAQLLDSTLDEIVNDAIDEQVEQQLDDEISDAVEQQVDAVVESAVEQQIEDAVTGTLVEQVEAGVTETVQQQLESGVTGTIAQQLQSTVERALEGELEDVVGDGLEDVVEGGLGPLVDGAGQVVELATGAGNTDDANGSSAPAAATTFVAGLDAVGRAAESEIWVILVPAEHVERIAAWGFNVRVRQDLAGLNRVLLRVDAPEDRDIAQAALELALDAPGTLVDFNHVYTPTDDERGDAAAAAAARPQTQSLPEPRPALTIGIVDSAIATDHAAFADAEIVQRDFVSFAAPRPLAHGTAVASILVGKDGVLRRSGGRARLHAAAVFFNDAAQQPIATTESLVAALAWHAAEGVEVVNMSLAGPPNRVLEAAIAAAAEHGTLVVAAVGNNGPAAEPLYPAAYPPVVAVTAVDSANHVYRYANRGRHVMFAAPGVGIRVADSDGGYATESGTSMAAPYAAAVIARAAAKSDAPPPGKVITALQATALDLGAKDFDDVFGYGLIASGD